MMIDQTYDTHNTYDIGERFEVGEIVNPNIILYEDGTKIRPNKYDAYFPESIDLKITNKCNHNCQYCHEMSDINGKSFDVEEAIKLLQYAPFPTEIAIGGGNPAHCIQDINYMIKKLPNCVINVTLNQYDIWAIPKINANAFGISINNVCEIDQSLKLCAKQYNVVLHIINGLHYVHYLLYYAKYFTKILVLGYKTFGRGADYLHNNQWQIEGNISEWKKEIVKIIKEIGEEYSDRIIAFDNLAFRQLDLLFQTDNPANFMGHDGEYSMYIDMVNKQYAKSSVDTKYDINNKTLHQMFKYI
jgi:hypothetical protein